MNQTLQAALNFHDAGICVVPARTDGSKAPDGSWKQYQIERPSREQIIKWFENGHQGIGIICGKVSGNLEMLELEGRAVSSGLLDQARELAVNSGLAEIWEVMVNGYSEVTPSGGIHFLYRIADEEVPGNTKIARRPGENDSIEVLVETRGEGGFVITAPSCGTTHPSGQPWQLLKGSPATIAMLSFEEREALHDIFRALDQMPVKEQIAQSLGSREQTGERPGDDFNNRATWKEILEPKGWKVVFTANGVTYWRRPGKTTGISATTGRNDGDNLFVFTTSTIFEAEKPYSKFAAFTHLEFGGNYSEASKALRVKGYGASNLQSLPSNLTNYAPHNSQVESAKPNLYSIESLEPANFEESTWKPVNLQQFFDGTFKQIETEILKRNDGIALFYSGKVHSLYGESESGKSWVAQIATAEQLKASKKVTYIDFESDAADIVNRLRKLKVTQAEILQFFTYIKPDDKTDFRDPYWQKILEPNSASLVIIDGVTESLNIWGNETKDNDGITKWMRGFPRVIAEKSGAAIVLIDHVTKDAQSRGRFAIGGQAKLASLDGSAYLVEPLEALAPGRIGSLTVRVTKDRPGFIRGKSGLYRKTDRTQEAAVITIDSTKEEMQWVIQPPSTEEQLKAAIEDKAQREILEFVANNPGTSKSKVAVGVKGKNAAIADHLEDLIAEGLIENKGNDRNFVLYVTGQGKEKLGQIDALVIPING